MSHIATFTSSPLFQIIVAIHFGFGMHVCGKYYLPFQMKYGQIELANCQSNSLIEIHEIRSICARVPYIMRIFEENPSNPRQNAGTNNTKCMIFWYDLGYADNKFHDRIHPPTLNFDKCFFSRFHHSRNAKVKRKQEKQMNRLSSKTFDVGSILSPTYYKAMMKTHI